MVIIFTNHAIERWRERVDRIFAPLITQRLVMESRQATKSERRRRATGDKCTSRKATAYEKLTCRVHDAAGVMFFLVIEGDRVCVKTVLKLS